MANDGNDEVLPISEFRDDARLRSNLFLTQLQGREPIASVLTGLDALCQRRAVTRRERRGHREFIRSKAVLSKDQPFDIEAVCIRDDDGWIYAASLHIEPSFAVGLLAGRLAEILNGRSQPG